MLGMGPSCGGTKVFDRRWPPNTPQFPGNFKYVPEIQNFSRFRMHCWDFLAIYVIFQIFLLFFRQFLNKLINSIKIQRKMGMKQLFSALKSTKTCFAFQAQDTFEIVVRRWISGAQVFFNALVPFAMCTLLAYHVNFRKSLNIYSKRLHLIS